MKYGTFMGDADPVSGMDNDSPARLIDFAMDRVADSLLTTEQLLGVLNFAIDAIEVRDEAIFDARKRVSSARDALETIRQHEETA